MPLILLSYTTPSPANQHNLYPPMGGIVSLASSLLSDERSRHALLPRPSTICQDCWEGPFAAYLGLFSEPVQETGNGDRSRFVGGPSLTTTWDPLESRVAAGCRWCEFLAGLIRPWGVQGAKVLGQLEFTVGRPTHFSPVHTQEFVVACNGRRHFQGYVCTAAGGLQIDTHYGATADTYNQMTLLHRS